MQTTTTLLAKRLVADGTMEFTFARPDGFAFAAGQTVDITLIEPPETDAEGNTRTFSLVGAPHEEHLRITTRLRDTAFKRVLKDMPIDSPIMVDGPHGSFTLHENAARSAVFLAGGIGITPFHSIIADATRRALPHRLFLFFSNRRPEDAAFLGDFEACAAENPNFTFVPTMTDMEKSQEAWTGERGYIDAAMLARYVPADANAIYYLAGPEGMVAAMRTMLNESGVGNDDIRFEEFAGY